MLTVNDLKLIRQVVKEEIAIQMTPLKRDVEQLKKDVSLLRKDVTQLKKDVNIVITFFDNEMADLKTRVTRLEKDKRWS